MSNLHLQISHTIHPVDRSPWASPLLPRTTTLKRTYSPCRPGQMGYKKRRLKHVYVTCISHAHTVCIKQSWVAVVVTMASSGFQVLVHCCPFCDTTTSNMSQCFSHLRSSHASDPSFQFTCGIDGCKKTYLTFSALNTHVYRHHRSKMMENSSSLSKTVPLADSSDSPLEPGITEVL